MVRGGALQITPWERQALQMLANGQTAADVADRLGMSAPDTTTLLAELFGAMGAATQAEAIAAADRRGLLACATLVNDAASSSGHSADS